MRQVGSALRRFLESEDGPAAVEYEIMTALIVVLCMNIISVLGTTTSSTFSKVNSALS